MNGLRFRFAIYRPLALVEALAAIRPAVRRMDGVLLVLQRAAAGGACFFVLGFIQINALRVARLVRDVEDGRDGFRIAVDNKRLLGCLLRRIRLKINLPVDAIFRH